MPLYSQQQPAIPAGWLQGPNAQTWLRAMGSIKDWLAYRTKQSILARFPLTCPPDSLAYIATERQILQGLNQSQANFRLQLQTAENQWAMADSAWGLLAELALAGYTTAYVVSTNGYLFGPSGVGQDGLTPVRVPAPAKGNVAADPGNPPVFASGTLGAVTQTGSGTAAMTVSGNPLGNYSIVVKILAGALTFDYSTDGGATYASVSTPVTALAHSVKIPLGATGISIEFGSGSWVAADTFAFTATKSVWVFTSQDGQQGGIPDAVGRFWSRFGVIFNPIGSTLPATDPAQQWNGGTGGTGTQSLTVGSVTSTGAKVSGMTGAVFAAASVGQWVTFSGFANAGNNGTFQITSVVSATSITIATTTAMAETHSATWQETLAVNPPTTTSAPTKSELNLIRTIIGRWKGGHASCMALYAFIGSSPWLWGFPPTPWGGSSTWGSGSGSAVVWTFAQTP